MPTWNEFAAESPVLAEATLARLTANRHHVLATLRADGSPRVSGTEVNLVGEELILGSMAGAVKVSDLLRDPRFALHTNPGDSSMAGGDAKISGIAVHITDPGWQRRIIDELQAPEPCELFRFDLRQVVLTTIDADLMYVQSWTPTNGLQRWARSATDGTPVPVDPAG